MNKEKVIRTNKNHDTETGYLNEKGIFILHSFDDEPAIIFTNSGTKYWYKDGLVHRDNNLPAAIYAGGSNSLYKNDKHYWFINEEECYDIDDVYEKFKNNILYLPNVYVDILKDNGIDVIFIDWCECIILDQSQYNLAILKFL